MKNKVSGGRIIISLCMDKERDEKLIDFLNSKPNKSDYIRSILNEKIDMMENPQTNNNEFVTNALLEIASNLSSLTDKILSLGDNKIYSPALPTTQTQVNTAPQHTNIKPVEENIPSIPQSISQSVEVNDAVADGTDMIFNNVLNAINNA